MSDRHVTQSHDVVLTPAGVEITADDIDRLLARDSWLMDLESAGVDNWAGIDYAHDLRREREENTDD